MNTRLTSVLCPLITLVLLLTAWVLYLKLFEVPDYILPHPVDVLETIHSAYGSGIIYPHLLFTVKSTVMGYLMGCGAALVMGGLVAESRIFEKFVYPYVILLQSMPKVALAPLIIVWFGFGIESKIAMVVLICFFPVFINTVVGIRQADPDMIDVFRACNASRARIFFHIKVPSAGTSIFAGLQIAVVLGLIGAVVAEFVAAKQGLGTMLQSAAVDLDTALMLTGVFTLAIIGLCGNLFIRFLHRRMIFWEAQAQTPRTTDLEAS